MKFTITLANGLKKELNSRKEIVETLVKKRFIIKPKAIITPPPPIIKQKKLFIRNTDGQKRFLDRSHNLISDFQKRLGKRVIIKQSKEQ